MAFPDILIGSKFDAKGFKQAETAVSKLTKNVKSAAGALGIALSARAVFLFGKASVKAFSEAEKSNAQLANTVKNLGLAFAQSDITNFLDKISASSGIAGETLNEAFKSLLTTSGSVLKSQELLRLALDISAGSGVDLVTATNDLAQAYVGNTRGLKKYNLGLTQAELKSASFLQVQEKLNDQFSGANAQKLDTFAGKMQVLGEAAGNAQEIIGEGLVDALAILAGDSSLDTLIGKIKTLAENIGDFFRGLAIGFRDLANMPVIKQLIQLSAIMLKIIGKVAGAVPGVFIDAGRNERNSKNMPLGASQFLEDQNASANRAAAAKAEAAAKKRAKELLAAQTKNTAELKKQAALKKSQGVFDVEQAGLLAALKGKLTDDEANRVKALLAIQNENSSAATYYSNLVIQAQDKTGALARLIRDLPTAKDPFSAWLYSLQQVEIALDKIKDKLGTPTTTPAGTFNYGESVNLIGNPLVNVKQSQPGSQDFIGPVVVQIDGKAIASVVQDQALNGNATTINRSVGDFQRVTSG